MFRHSFYNLLGLGLPLLAAVITIPLLIQALGTERFGILTLVWALVSYFGLFDLGLGRALTQRLASRWAHGEEGEADSLIETAVTATATLGVAAGVLLAVSANWAVERFGGVSDPRETVKAIYWMACAVPFVIVTSVLRGVLEARNAFGVLNAIRLPMGLYTFVAPLAVVYYWKNDLGAIALALAIGRIVAFAAHWLACGLGPVSGAPRRPLLRDLLTTGGWMTVSNVVSPLMGYLDRFVIGLTISVSAVAYYVTPYEIITKLWIVPAALTAVLLPRFAGAAPAPGPSQGNGLFRHSVLLLFVILFPITLAIALFAQELLNLWLGGEFASQSFRLLQVFAFGILVNSLAHVPLTYLQGVGHARVVATIHFWELPAFVVILWFAAETLGLVGAVLAWLARILVDTALMFFYAIRTMGRSPHRSIEWVHVLLFLIPVGAFAAGLLESPSGRIISWGGAVSLVALLVWKEVLSPGERMALLKRTSYVAG